MWFYVPISYTIKFYIITLLAFYYYHRRRLKSTPPPVTKWRQGSDQRSRLSTCAFNFQRLLLCYYSFHCSTWFTVLLFVPRFPLNQQREDPEIRLKKWRDKWCSLDQNRINCPGLNLNMELMLRWLGKLLTASKLICPPLDGCLLWIQNPCLSSLYYAPKATKSTCLKNLWRDTRIRV